MFYENDSKESTRPIADESEEICQSVVEFVLAHDGQGYDTVRQKG